MCWNFYMLYYLENTDLTECRTSGHARYKPKTCKEKTLVAHRKLRYFTITLRPQRLFLSPKTIEHMTWNHSHDAVNEIIVYPSDGEAWKHLNRVYPQFLIESLNTHLGLCTDKFNLFDSFVANYFWYVILIVYNLLLRSLYNLPLKSSCFYLRSYLVLKVQVRT
jgi:hypothetical protein